MGKYINIGNDGFRKADSAIRQIKEKRYAGVLTDFVDDVLLVGINYSKKTKKHECVIERLAANVPHDVPHENKNVPHDVLHERQEQIRQYVRINPIVTRKELAEKLNVSVKTIARALEQMPDVRYVGSGDKGHWEVD